jgi:hypothetical protein
MARIWKSGNDLLFCIQLDAYEMSQCWLWNLARVNSQHCADLHVLHPKGMHFNLQTRNWDCSAIFHFPGPNPLSPDLIGLGDGIAYRKMISSSAPQWGWGYGGQLLCVHGQQKPR